MSRAADYTIKGFLYQFNKTLLEILRSDNDDVITVEGVVEDVEIASLSGTTAIQCKYHEASEAFAPSRVYRPVLQMMLHYHENENPEANIKYVLFAHFPGVEAGAEPQIGPELLRAALASTNREYEHYVGFLRDRIDVEAFLERFTVEFGPSYEKQVAQVVSALEANGVPSHEIGGLAYPNALHMVAEISTRHDPDERRISKGAFLTHLKSIRKTAVSRWTLALRSRKQVLDARRKQLKGSLNINARMRGIIIDADSLNDYAEEIVLFIRDYVEKYSSKAAHVCTPTIYLCTSADDFQNVQYRLYQKGVRCNDGCVAGRWDETCFLRDPLHQGKGQALQREFSTRIVRWQDHDDIVDAIKCDDLFVIGEHDCGSLGTTDVNVEQLAVTSLKEARYLMGVSDAYE